MALIRATISKTITEHPEHRYSIDGLGIRYLSFLSGADTALDVWRGLWISAQLSFFRGPGALSHTLNNTLKKLFKLIGTILSDAAILLSQSRQVAIAELSVYMNSHPHPRYLHPKHLYCPSTEFTPLTKTELAALRISAVEEMYVRSPPISLYKTSRKIKQTGSTIVSSSAAELCTSSLTPSSGAVSNFCMLLRLSR